MEVKGLEGESEGRGVGGGEWRSRGGRVIVEGESGGRGVGEWWFRGRRGRVVGRGSEVSGVGGESGG